MNVTRPVECPACGHERILRRPGELRTETKKLRLKLSIWICALCGYEWSKPRMRSLNDEWERV